MRTLAIHVAFFAALLVPPVLLFTVGRTRGRGTWASASQMLVCGVSLGFFAVMANWSFVGVGALPLCVSVFLVLYAVRAARGHRASLVCLVGCLAIAVAPIAWLYQEGDGEEALRLHFPLPATNWYVGQGGGNLLLNHHQSVRAQGHALDILGLNALGMRAKGILPRDLEAYAIYDDPVVAPCAGEVLATRNDVEDETPPTSSPGSLLGNHVTLACQGATVLLAHLRVGSVEVQVGDVIEAGHALGRVGNSGNTTEPHLHIHAVEGRVTELQALAFEARPIPLDFEGIGRLRKHANALWHRAAIAP